VQIHLDRGGSPLSSDKQTKEKLLLAARREFLEKGYRNASLRSICKESGVTTGALYFFFQDKNDLFRELVEAPLQMLIGVMQEHFDYELKEIMVQNKAEGNSEEDLRKAKDVIELIYDHFDSFDLLLMKSEGSAYEKMVDQFISVAEKHYRTMADIMSEINGGKRVDDYMIHWISHLQVSAFAQLIEHRVPRQAALVQMENMTKFMQNGWLGMF
jgi:AcrR family transcriptional regulator